jgi:hypothetical protein
MNVETIGWLPRAAVDVLLGLFAIGCTSKPIDGSTHFLCGSDAECPAEKACVDTHCVARPVTPDASRAPDGNPEASTCPGIDTDTDPENCGACGTVCGPTTLASSVLAFAMDATNVYWTDENAGTVMKMPLAGGTPTTLATGQSFLGEDLASNGNGFIALDASSVYWMAQGAIRKVPLEGGNVVTLASGILGKFLEVNTFVVTDTSVLYGLYACDSSDGGSCSPTETVMEVPTAGGTPTTLVPEEGISGLAPLELYVVAQNVVWRNAGTIRKVPLGGGTPETLATGLVEPRALFAHGTNVYWAEQSQCNGAGDAGCPATIKTVPVAGGNPSTLVSNVPRGLFRIVVDDTRISWVTVDLTAGPSEPVDFAITSMPLAGGTPVTVATRQTQMGAVAFDAENAYWITRGKRCLRQSRSSSRLWSQRPRRTSCCIRTCSPTPRACTGNSSRSLRREHSRCVRS